LCGLLPGGFAARGRIDLLSFLAFRPVILAICVVAAMRLPWRSRVASYLLALVALGGSEAMLVALLGGPVPWAQLGRGWASGAALLLAYEAVAMLARQLPASISRGGLALILALLTLWPNAPLQYLYARGVHPSPRLIAAPKQPVFLLTGLPLVWGEGPTGPPHALSALQRFYRISAIDTLPRTAANPLLLVQPRNFGPEELVAFDQWIRAGGKALILADPSLRWPSRYPMGDPRSPPSINNIEPWLRHIGLLDRPANDARQTIHVAWKARRYRIRAYAPGLLRRMPGSNCFILKADFLADCRVGRGRALVLSDADLLQDDYWRLPGDGRDDDLRTADNIALVADIIAVLSEMRPPSEQVAWIENPSRVSHAGAAALIPGLVLMTMGAVLFRSRH